MVCTIPDILPYTVTQTLGTLNLLHLRSIDVNRHEPALFYIDSGTVKPVQSGQTAQIPFCC